MQALAGRLPGMRGIYAGRLRNARQVEALTINLVSVNRRYKVHAGRPGHRRLSSAADRGIAPRGPALTLRSCCSRRGGACCTGPPSRHAHRRADRPASARGCCWLHVPVSLAILAVLPGRRRLPAHHAGAGAAGAGRRRRATPAASSGTTSSTRWASRSRRRPPSSASTPWRSGSTLLGYGLLLDPAPAEKDAWMTPQRCSRVCRYGGPAAPASTRNTRSRAASRRSARGRGRRRRGPRRRTPGPPAAARRAGRRTSSRTSAPGRR